jgi:hypothetical protein
MADCGLSIADGLFRIADCRWPIPDCRLPIVNPIRQSPFGNVNLQSAVCNLQSFYRSTPGRQ